MNSLVLPKPAQGEAKDARMSFKHYHVVQGHIQYSGFFYIGTNGDNIAKLVNIHKNGVSRHNQEHAMSELLRLMEKEGPVLPEFIIYQAGPDMRRMIAFSSFLQSHAALRCIPFIVDASGLCSGEITLLKNAVRPDEIVILAEMSDAELQSKVKFLRRMKVRVAAAARPEIEEHQPVNMNLGLMSKRAFDILVATVAILIFCPLMLLIAIAIRLESRGPILYIAKRAGRGYRVFNFYKFRTMVQDADKKLTELAHLNQYGATTGPVFFKVSNDPRITRLGSFLRNTSLDELPQLFNVLLGDMSLVGNRPLPLYEAESLTTDDYAARFMAPAGITGLWQIKKRGSKDMSIEERISIDIDYAHNCSFSTDLWIIAKTPTALLQKDNV
jgi:lipopolysaccharide/colanic/teichoic acid biosynthesis glycosyltransferase